MRLVFVSNYLSVHQLPFCLFMYEKLEDHFCFIATKETREERLSQGYSDLNSKYPFVVRAYECETERQRAKQMVDAAEIVVLGGAPTEFLQTRLQAGKLTFLYSERLYKEPYPAWKLPLQWWRFRKNYGKGNNLYLLCASAYTAGDFARTRNFLGKAYKWGYFPQTFQYDDVNAMIEKKVPGSILWAARFIDWKHPEYVVEVARRLKAEGYRFQIKMLGSGEIWEDIDRQVKESGLEDCVELTGAIPAEEVRKFMDAASVFLFTSDRQEGWGAVLNESMNSGCAVVASDAIGSVPFLLENGKNGLQFRSGDVEDLYRNVKYLLDHPKVCKTMGHNAYETIAELWNAETAAQRLLQLAQALQQGEKQPRLFETGPCSVADILQIGCTKTKGALV